MCKIKFQSGQILYKNIKIAKLIFKNLKIELIFKCDSIYFWYCIILKDNYQRMSKSPNESISSANSRVAETRKTSGIIAKISSITRLLLKNWELVKPLWKLNNICSKSDLQNWEWIYSDYFFAGNSGNLNIDTEIWFADSSDIKLFATWEFLRNITDRWLDFDSNQKARSILHELISNMITGISITSESHRNFKNAIEFAKTKDKKLVILANHISHFDAPFLDYAFTQDLLHDSDMDVRLVCWAFMYYNTHVRPFVKCFNTTFVFWPADSREMMETIRQNDRQNGTSDFKLFRTLKDSFEAGMNSNKDNEITILFPYAWRADSMHSNFIYGCKDSIDPSMKPLLSLPDCIYLPLWINWPWNIFPWNPRWGWDMIANLASTQQTQLCLEFSTYFTGWQLELSQIHDEMIETSKKSFR